MGFQEEGGVKCWKEQEEEWGCRKAAKEPLGTLRRSFMRAKVTEVELQWEYKCEREPINAGHRCYPFCTGKGRTFHFGGGSWKFHLLPQVIITFTSWYLVFWGVKFKIPLPPFFPPLPLFPNLRRVGRPRIRHNWAPSLFSPFDFLDFFHTKRIYQHNLTIYYQKNSTLNTIKTLGVSWSWDWQDRGLNGPGSLQVPIDFEALPGQCGCPAWLHLLPRWRLFCCGCLTQLQIDEFPARATLFPWNLLHFSLCFWQAGKVPILTE